MKVAKYQKIFYFMVFLRLFFLMWAIYEVFIELVTMFPFYVLVLWG